MVEENDNRRGRPAAERKVAPSPPADAVGTGGTPAADPDPATEAEPARRPRRSTPFWRKGRFWVAVIALEVAAALVISFTFERSPTEVDLAGGDLTAFCAQVRTLQDQRAAAAAAGDEPTSVTDPARFEQERDAYLALVPVAPSDLVPDLERLAELDETIIETVEQLAARKAEDPSYSGIAELTAQLDRVSAEGRVAAARVDVVLVDGCGIDPGVQPTTTVAGPVPGSAPR